MAGKLSLKELIARLHTPGWQLVTDKEDRPHTGTLKEVLETTHQRHQEKRTPGLIRQIETTVELDMIQIEQLWHHMGLPTV
jgi:hypothetical protein